MSLTWDHDYLALAKFWALRRSKDPSLRCCSVIVRQDKTLASMGYNGFPIGIADTIGRLRDRAQKHPRIIHAEINAITLAREPLHGYTIYVWPCCSCPPCAAVIIQSGIGRVVNPLANALENPKYGTDDWRLLLDISRKMFREAGVRHDELVFTE